MAGVSRLQYSTETRLIRVMCSGRIDLEFVLRAFFNGMDGVFIGGCRLGECNYTTHGNYHALNMVLLCKKIMEHIGLNPDRLRLEFMSAGDGLIFADVVGDFGKKIKQMGPIGDSEGLDRKELRLKIEQVRKLVPYIKIVKREKLDSHLERKEEYDTLFSREEIDRLFQEVVSYYIDPEKCRACGMCLKKCPVDAVIGAKKQIHVIDQDKCIKCGTCFEACPTKFQAVTKITGKPVPAPIPMEDRMILKKSEEKQ